MKFFQIITVCASLASISALAKPEATTGLKYSADKLVQTKKSDIVELIGNAQVTQGETTIKGKKIILNVKTGKAIVEGNAQFTTNRMTVSLPESTVTQP